MKNNVLALPLGLVVALAGCSSETAVDSGRNRGTPMESGSPGSSQAQARPYDNAAELMKPPAGSKPLVSKQTEFAKEFPALKIRVHTEGGVDAPVLEHDNVGRFHLVITLSNGKEVENTRRPQDPGAEPEPRMFLARSQEKLKGLGLAVVGMKVGEVRHVIIPPELGLGEEGDYLRGIPENATLTVRAELVEVVGPMVRVWKEGDGDAIQRGQVGRFHYTGVLAKDGTKFDSTREENKGPTLIPLKLSSDAGDPGGVIEGWVLGLVGMKVGERRWLLIPSPLAYGAQGKGPVVRPHADLVFEAELVELVKN